MKKEKKKKEKKKKERGTMVRLAKLDKLPKVGQNLYEFIEREGQSTLLVKYVVLPLPEGKTIRGMIKLEFAEEAPGYPKGTHTVRNWKQLYRKVILEKRMCIIIKQGAQELVKKAKKYNQKFMRDLLIEAKKLTKETNIPHVVQTRWQESEWDTPLDGPADNLRVVPTVELKPEDILGKKTEDVIDIPYDPIDDRIKAIEKGIKENQTKRIEQIKQQAQEIIKNKREGMINEQS